MRHLRGFAMDKNVRDIPRVFFWLVVSTLVAASGLLLGFSVTAAWEGMYWISAIALVLAAAAIPVVRFVNCVRREMVDTSVKEVVLEHTYALDRLSEGAAIDYITQTLAILRMDHEWEYCDSIFENVDVNKVSIGVCNRMLQTAKQIENRIRSYPSLESRIIEKFKDEPRPL